MIKRRNLEIGYLITILLLVNAGSIQASIITVGPGASYDFSAIQAGIDAANDWDTVLVAPGEYVITEPITFLGKAITVKSETGPDETTIRMGMPADSNRGSVVIFENNETVASILEGFTITGGRGSWVAAAQAWGGGGIYFQASSGTVRDCVIVQNSTENGGGVGCAFDSSVTMSDCIITDNSAGNVGGGVMGWVNSSITVTNCVVTENSCSESIGGGVYCGGQDSSQESFLTMTDCIVSGNSSRANGGGGVACWYGSLTMTRCEIVSNTAQDWFGGGVYAGHSSATLTNCVIARNTAVQGGGGVCSSYADAFITISNCTIWGNSGGVNAGGGGVLSRVGSTTITNSIVCGNTSAKGREISLITGGKLDIVYSNVAGGQTGVNMEGGCTLDWGQSNIHTDPYLADPNNDDYHLKSEAGRWNPDTQAWVQDDVTSLCLDAGDPFSPIGLEPFPSGGFVNMGAYGGTPEASKAYFGEPVCETVVAGDINGDGQVNRADLEIMALHWTDPEPLQP